MLKNIYKSSDSDWKYKLQIKDTCQTEDCCRILSMNELLVVDNSSFNFFTSAIARSSPISARGSDLSVCRNSLIIPSPSCSRENNTDTMEWCNIHNSTVALQSRGPQINEICQNAVSYLLEQFCGRTLIILKTYFHGKNYLYRIVLLHKTAHR